MSHAGNGTGQEVKERESGTERGARALFRFRESRTNRAASEVYFGFALLCREGERERGVLGSFKEGNVLQFGGCVRQSLRAARAYCPVPRPAIAGR